MVLSSFWHPPIHWKKGNVDKLELACRDWNLKMQLLANLGHPDKPHFPDPFFLTWSVIGRITLITLFWRHLTKMFIQHIVPHKKFDRVGGTSSLTFPNFKYGGPREICVERNCFDSPITK